MFAESLVATREKELQHFLPEPPLPLLLLQGFLPSLLHRGRHCLLHLLCGDGAHEEVLDLFCELNRASATQTAVDCASSGERGQILCNLERQLLALMNAVSTR